MVGWILVGIGTKFFLFDRPSFYESLDGHIGSCFMVLSILFPSSICLVMSSMVMGQIQYNCNLSSFGMSTRQAITRL